MEITLAIAAFDSQGRVGVMLSSVQFSTAPGEILTIPISVLNRGVNSDTFRLGVEGIPVSWVSTTTPLIPLGAGENKEISLLIRPALSPSSQAGRYKFYITMTSQAAPEQVVRVDCLLTVAALQPVHCRVGTQECQIRAANRSERKERGEYPPGVFPQLYE